jgi:hypothetical protein
MPKWLSKPSALAPMNMKILYHTIWRRQQKYSFDLDAWLDLTWVCGLLGVPDMVRPVLSNFDPYKADGRKSKERDIQIAKIFLLYRERAFSQIVAHDIDIVNDTPEIPRTAPLAWPPAPNGSSCTLRSSCMLAMPSAKVSVRPEPEIPNQSAPAEASAACGQSVEFDRGAPPSSLWRPEHINV